MSLSTANVIDSDPDVSAKLVVRYRARGQAVWADKNEALGKIGLHSFPLNRLINTANVRVNGSLTMSTNVKDNIDSMQYMLSKKELKRLSTTGVPDHLMVYDNTVLTDVLRPQTDSLSFSRGLGATKVEGFEFGVVDINGVNYPSTVTVTYELSEKLMARPFSYLESDPKVFKGINSLVVDLNMISDFTQAVAADNSVDVFGVELHDVAIRVRSCTPHANLKVPVADIGYYNSPVFDYLTKETTNAVAAGASKELTVGPRVFTTIPKMYAVFASAPRASANQPVQLFPITRLSIKAGIKSNLMASYDSRELYNISVKNGYNGSPSQFFGGIEGSRGTGCVVYLTNADFDTGLLAQSNVLQNFNFSLTANFTNTAEDVAGVAVAAAAAGNPAIPVARPAFVASQKITLHVIAISDAYIKSENGIFTETIASLLQDDVSDRAVDLYENMTFEGNRAVLGGSVWSWMKKHIVKPAVKFARNNVGKLHTGIGPLDAVAKEVGKLVDDNSYVGRQAIKHGLGQRGGAVMNLGGANTVLGGKKLSQAQMLALLDM
jgi:hypothetical protein